MPLNATFNQKVKKGTKVMTVLSAGNARGLHLARLTAFVLVVASAAPAYALDGAPYTREAAVKIDRAAGKVEVRRANGNAPIERFTALYRTVDEIYSKAGYSLEKSLLRYLRDLEKSGIPELHPAAQALGSIYVTAMDVPLPSQNLERIVRPETYRIIVRLKESSEKEQRAKESEKAQREAEWQARQSEGARQREEEKRAQTATLINEYSRVSDGRYSRGSDRPTSPENAFFDLKFIGGNIFALSGESTSRSSRSSRLCKLPEVQIPVKREYSDRELVGDTSIGGCSVSLTLKGKGSIWVEFKPDDKCAQYCSSGRWTGGFYESAEVRDATASGAPSKDASSPEKRALQEELAARNRGAAKGDSGSTSPQSDPPKAVQDAVRTLEGLFKKR